MERERNRSKPGGRSKEKEGRNEGIRMKKNSYRGKRWE